MSGCRVAVVIVFLQSRRRQTRFASGAGVQTCALPIWPVASAAHRDRVETYIAIGKDEGRLVAGGGRPKNRNHGYFVETTIFADIDNGDRNAREEIFRSDKRRGGKEGFKTGRSRGSPDP